MNALIKNLVSTNAGWLARQAVKYSAVAATIITTWLIGRGFDTTHAGVIAAGTTSAVLGIIEASLSWTARKYAVPELDAVNAAIEAARKLPVIIAFLALTGCAGFVASAGSFLGSSSGHAVIALVEMEAKNLESTWEAEKIPAVIARAQAAIAKLPAKTGNELKDLSRNLQERGWNDLIALALKRYTAITGHAYVAPKNPVSPVVP